MLNAYQEVGARMSLKMHYLHSHLDFFRKTMLMSRMSTVSGFAKTLNLLKIGTMEMLALL